MKAAGLAFRCLTAAVALSAGGASAVVWTGATDNNWSTATNWVGNAVPASSNSAVIDFTNASANRTPNADAVWTMNALGFDSIGVPYVLTGSKLFLNGIDPIITNFGGTNTVQNDVEYVTAGIIANFSAATLNLTGALTGAGAIQIDNGSASSTVVISGSTSFTGPVTLTGGILQVGDGAAGPNFLGPITNNGSILIAVPLGVFLAGPFTGSGPLRVQAGLLSCFACGALTHTGSTTIDAGARLDGQIVNNARLTVNGEHNSGGSTVGSLAGTGDVHINGAGSVLELGGDGTNATFSGATLDGAGGITKVGAGNQVLAHTSTYTGPTTVSGGTLTVGDGVNGPSSIAEVIVNAAIAFNAPFGAFLTGPFTGSGTLRVQSGLVACFACGFLAHTGSTTIDAGARLDGQIVNNARLTVNGEHNSGGSQIGSLDGSGTLNLNGVGSFLNTGGDNTSTTFAGTIASDGALQKNGSGVLRLTGNNTNAAGSVVNAGALRIDGTHTGPVTVNSGATLFGVGTVGPVVVNAGGNLAPGASPGALNTGNLSLFGNLLQEIEGTTPGTQYDTINVTGSVTLTGSTLVVSGAYVPATGDTFAIINNDGADPVVGIFNGLAEGATVIINGRAATISYVGGTGNDVVLTVAPAPAGVGGPPIPTLSEWMLVLLALLMLTIGLRNSRSFRNNQ
jgi:fibronectin-binding autotransporter adhesin